MPRVRAEVSVPPEPGVVITGHGSPAVVLPAVRPRLDSHSKINDQPDADSDDAEKNEKSNAGGARIRTRKACYGRQHACWLHAQCWACGPYTQVCGTGQPPPASTGGQSASLMHASEAVWQ